MRSLIVFMLLMTFISCDDNELLVQIEDLSCSTSADKFVNFKIGDNTKCWTESNQVRVDNVMNGNCGIGYEDVINPHLATGIRGYICNPSSENCLGVEESLIFYFIHSCNSFDEQDKFYNLVTTGNYQLAKSKQDFGKFYIEYFENSTWYTTINSSLNNGRIEIIEVKNIAPYFVTLNDGTKSGISAGLELTIRASFDLYTENGQFVKRVTGSKIKGVIYRPTPFGIEWDDYYGD